MMYAALADLVLLAHLAFVLFVLFGGWLALRWPGLAWAHVPAAVWGTWVEFSGWICPLTPLENRLRVLAGFEAYRGDFVQHYVLGILYPPALTRNLQMLFAVTVLLLNAGAYFLFWRARVDRKRVGG
jgi:hypothetical protein